MRGLDGARGIARAALCGLLSVSLALGGVPASAWAEMTEGGPAYSEDTSDGFDSGAPEADVPDTGYPSAAGEESADVVNGEPSDEPDETGQPAGDYDDEALQEEEAIADEEDAPAIVAEEPLAASAPDADALEADTVVLGKWGECSWSIDAGGLLRVWPTNGESGRLADSRGYSPWSSYDSDAYFPWYENGAKITSVEFDPGVSLPSNCSGMFSGCRSLASLDIGGWDTSSVTNMSSMFSGCRSLASLDVSGWDTSSVTDMGGLFGSCSSLTSLDLSGWDTSSVTDMGSMFSYCSSLTSLDLSGWDTSSVTDMGSMFSGCTLPSSLDLSGWDTSSVTDMSDMFSFSYLPSSLDLSGWDTSSVVHMGAMFQSSHLVSLDLSAWDTSSVTFTGYMFSGCSSLSSLDLSGWDTSSVDDMLMMFYDCSSLSALDVSGWDTSSVEDMNRMFYGCSSLVSLDFSDWDTSSVRDMSDMFYGCSSLVSLDLSGWSPSLNMTGMFSGCSSLVSLDLSGWDTSSVKFIDISFIGYMFDGCSSLARISVGERYDTSKAFPAATAASGKWYSAKAGEWFTVGEIQRSRRHVADTYTAGEPSLDVSGATLSPIADQTYTGEAIEPGLTVKMGNKALRAGTDYSLSYTGNVNAGTATVVVTGMGSYWGSRIATFRIVPASISACAVDPLAGQAYTGKAVTPAITVKCGSTVLRAGEDYSIAYENNVNAGTATATLRGIGNYTGTTNVAFEIAPADVAGAKVGAVADRVYSGEEVRPALDVALNGTALVADTDYTVTYKKNVNAGTATATLSGIGNYTGTTNVAFEIAPADIAGAKVGAVADRVYSGEEVKPALDVAFGDLDLVAGADYTVTYGDNVNAGTAKATLKGMGNYAGSKDVAFVIAPRPVKVTASDASKTYGAKDPELKATVSGLVGKDSVSYALSREQGEDAGAYAITPAGEELQGNYAVSYTPGTLTIKCAPLEEATISEIPAQVYTGSALQPEPTVTLGGRELVPGTDYDLSYRDNIASGTATVTVAGKGNYEGSKSVAFRIAQADVSACTVGPVADEAYTGKAIEPKPEVTFRGKKLMNGSDYTYAYKDNVNAGTATITVNGSSGNFTGTTTVSFKIAPVDIAQATVADIGSKTYTGSAIKSAPIVTFGTARLVPGTDYTVAYDKNVNVGTATATMTGKGNFTGTKVVEFPIAAADLSKASVDAIDDQWYTGSAVKPAPQVKLGSTVLKAGTDYTLSYENNVDVGTATVTVVGKGNYAGKTTTTFEIKVATQEMYRLYNPNSGEHFYTAKAGERDHLVKVGWNYEGIGWVAPVESKTPVYRLYNEVAGDHHYTMKEAERDALLKIKGWKYEGIGWYSDDAKGVPLYRQYNPNAVTGSHNYTTNKKENDFLVTHGWKGEGIGWYGVKQ